ncbi:MAG: hydrogenase maturation protease [Roseibium sp.]|nr:hydrogenase maturation protease [Roseibium sp.]
MLLVGYGNPGRGDDGLGPALAESIARQRVPGLVVDVDYQLVAEHALAVSAHDTVIFADAEIGGKEACSFRRIAGGALQSLESHSLAPETILALCETLYGAKPRGFVLGITGYAFGEVKEGLSAQAAANLVRAEKYLLSWLAANPPAAAERIP